MGEAGHFSNGEFATIGQDATYALSPKNQQSEYFLYECVDFLSLRD
jgi:hypothetical protein